MLRQLIEKLTAAGPDYRHTRLLGVDLDEHSVRLVEVAADGGLSGVGLNVIGVAEEEFPAELDADNAATLGKWVAEVRTRAGLSQGLPTVTGLAAQQFGWHTLRLPAAAESELWPMAEMQIRREQLLDGMSVEFGRLPSRTVAPGDAAPATASADAAARIEVLAGSVSNDLLSRLRTVLAAASDGGESMIALRPLGLVRLWQQLAPPRADATATLLDLGRSHSEIVISVGGVVTTSRSVPVGWASHIEHADEPGSAAPGSIAPGSIAPGSIAPGSIAPGSIATGSIAPAGEVGLLPLGDSATPALGEAASSRLGEAAATPPTDPDAWLPKLSAELRRTLIAAAARQSTPQPTEIHVFADSVRGAKLAERLRADGFTVKLLEPAAESDVRATPEVRARLSAINAAGLLGLASQVLRDRALPIDYQRPKRVRAEQQAAETRRTRLLVAALAVVTAFVLPLPFYVRQQREIDARDAALIQLSNRTKKAKLEAQKFEFFRDLWADRPEKAAPALLFDAIQAERKDFQAVKEKLARLKTLDEQAVRLARERDSIAGRAAEARRFGALRALGEVYAVCETVFGSERGGGGRGELTEFKVQPAPLERAAPAGSAARSNEVAPPARGRVVVKGRADTPELAQQLVDGLNARGGQVLSFSATPISGASRSGSSSTTGPATKPDTRTVSFELTYRPSFDGDSDAENSSTK